ncbi:D-alanyl-D-alanine carboxypeptidase/D-alanyl-D-alanine-endopeptidase (plasmid) [Alcanivorax sp. N3-2A]|nr:D-alanyl-D-alanine carboxypeptidase/D-alanyl-D-alanine-endopeptidase [Alcanivorax sp. N3-2A]ASK36906.1 D-alanyl-D-alanine carboxypeptidase/D-alanyl-D-alanine-endopeptidase [Alcanivorax sp. N3-2A]|tara:strand:- start:11574 stop:13097 length:1524 start_codon:yes stop_codon:yes gene_type:complete
MWLARRRRVFPTLALVSLLGLPLFTAADEAPAANDWPQKILETMKARALPSEDLALAAMPLDGPGEARFLNADTKMNPGSTMKVLTTYAALELLGPTFKWHTRLYTDGDVSNGVLKGNLYFVGAGDPKLTQERLWLLLRDLRASGIREIRGDLVLDGSYFRLPHGLPLFNDDGDDVHAPFLVEPDALLTNLNIFHIQMLARDSGVNAWLEPPLAGVKLDNQVTTSQSGGCPSSRRLGFEPATDANGTVTVTLTGNLPSGCRASDYLSLMNHADYTAALLRGLWQELGGRISGASREGRLPAGATLLGTTSSPDLVTTVRDINKWSSNVMARQLFLTIGAENRLAGDADDLASARRTVLDWLALKGIDTREVVLDNGSGLSRSARIAPRQQIKLLEQVWRSPFAAELIASLPLVAMDGTMHNRLRNTGLRGEGHVKTGSLTNVRAVAGFTRDRNNTTWAVSAIVNTPVAWKSTAVLDDVLKAVHGLPADDAAEVSQTDAPRQRPTPGG